MKLASKKTGLSLRLGAMAAVLLIGQQATAAGTDAGTVISNTATVNYKVGTIDQNSLSRTVDFAVDRRVDFSISVVDGTLKPIAPGESDFWVDFEVTNTSNSALDFNLVLAQMVGGAVGAGTDNANVTGVDLDVYSDTVANGGSPTARGVGLDYIDELPEDASIRVRVWGDAALGLNLANDDVAGVTLTAAAAEPATVGEGAVLTVVANTEDGVENVFADADNDNSEAAQDGWIVVAADLAVTKAFNVIAGDLGTGMPIPGATVEYTVTVVNSSATDAVDVVITDTITDDDPAVTLDLDRDVVDYAGNDIDVVNNGAQVACDVDGVADGCNLTGMDITVGDLAETSITVAGNTTLTIRYRVTIPN